MRQYNSVSPGGNPYTNCQKVTELKKLRKAKNITAVKLAKAIGISKCKMSEVEKGTAYISPEHLECIAVILETDVGAISEGLKTELIHKILKGSR